MSTENLSITGLFEIHITVPDSYIVPFRLYCMNSKYKPIYAISETMMPQLMLSKYKNRDITDSINKANSLKEELEKIGIPVAGVKVESMGSNKGVPEKENNLCSEENDFEYHIKFPVGSLEEYNYIV